MSSVPQTLYTAAAPRKHARAAASNHYPMLQENNTFARFPDRVSLDSMPKKSKTPVLPLRYAKTIF